MQTIIKAVMTMQNITLHDKNALIEALNKLKRGY